MTVNFTDNDLLLLEKNRIERFRSFFTNPLARCFLHLNQTNTLTIHCTEPWMVDELLQEVDSLCRRAWLVTGAERLSIYFVQEEIYTARTCLIKKRQSRSLRPNVKA
jgi:hypothetical protein